MAADQNAQVIAAKYRVQAAQARVGGQRASLLPQVSADLSKTSHTLNTATFGIDFPTPPGEPPFFDPNGQIIGPVNLTDVRGRLSQTLFNWSTIQRVRGANADVDAANAQLQAAAERVGTAAANAYVQALRAQQLYHNRQADVSLAQDLVAIAQQQLAGGTGVRLDVTRAQAQLATVNAQMVGARSGVERAKLALVRALGLPAGTPIALTDSLPPVTRDIPDPEEAVRVALAKRADVRALDAQIRAAELQVSATRAERLPSLNFVGDDGWIGKTWDTLLHTYDWGLQVSVPVFQGFRTRAREQEQRAQIGELETRRRDLQDQFGFDVRAAVLDVSAAIDQVDAATARLRLAEQELADARDRFQSGVAGSADVVTASLRLNDARTAYSDALVAYQTARVALAAAQGNVTELP
jgi:outer membrane protein TolC